MKRLLLISLSALSFVFSQATTDSLQETRQETRVLELIDGSLIKGKIVRQDSTNIEVKASYGSINLFKSQVRHDESESERYYRLLAHDNEKDSTNIGASRYFYSPSSFNLKKGDILFSQKQLFFSTFAFGLSDHFSLQVGSIVPLNFVSGAQNLILGAKWGQEIVPNFGVQAGIQRFAANDGSLNLPFVGVTFGSLTKHASINYTSIFVDEPNDGEAKFSHNVTLSGLMQASQHTSLLVETLFNVTETSPIKMGILGVRYHRSSFNMDIGIMFIEDVPVPLPWLDFSYLFSFPKK